LPTQKRKELIEAYSGKRATELDIETYPSLITINEDTLYTPAAAIEVFQSDKKIMLEQLHFNDEQAAAKASWLVAQVAAGGCACWITNTVNRAQAIYRELVKDKDLDVILIHGRFPQTHRQALETAVLEKYGKNGNRPQQGIVIGTQVLEQSLDLDFDMMATDLAPIDLILQRAGRLHRHTRPIENRHHHSHPVLHLNLEIGEADKHIYGLYLLKMTEAALAQRDTITLPEDYRALVETVYTAPEPNAKYS
jgi:CRISPR-associated endonuclease/helicase Cas3